MTGNKEQNELDPLVTVGMPVYNGQEYLRSSLDSIVQQTYRNIEVIISDNGSTDDTAAICAEYVAKDPRVRYVRQAVNLGAQRNYNFVMHQAVGKYFMWAACDDFWDSTFIETLIAPLESDPSCVGAMCPYFVVDESGNPIYRLLEFHELEDENRMRRAMKLACFKTSPVQFYGLFRTSALQKFQVEPCPVSPKYSAMTEYPVLFYLNIIGRIQTVDGTRFYHRMHGNQSGVTHIPLVTHSLIRLYMVYRLPSAVWQGSRSVLLTLIVLALTMFYALRSIIWQSVRRIFRLPERDLLVLQAPETETQSGETT